MCSSASSGITTTSAIDSRQREFVGVMFERSDEHDWFLAGGNVLRQVEPVVEVGGQCAGS